MRRRLRYWRSLLEQGRALLGFCNAPLHMISFAISFICLCMVTLLQNCADGEKDTNQLEREKVEPRRTTHLSSGSSSSFGEQVGPEPASPEVVGSDTRTPSNVEVRRVHFILKLIFHDNTGHAVTVNPLSNCILSREKTLFWLIITEVDFSSSCLPRDVLNYFVETIYESSFVFAIY